MEKIHILHLEDDANDALFIERAIVKAGIEAELIHARSAEEFTAALDNAKVDLVLSDSGLPGFSGETALKILRARRPDIPFIIISGAAEEEAVARGLAAGAADFISKEHLWQVAPAIRRVCPSRRAGDLARERDYRRIERHNAAMQRLVAVVQALSLARTLEQISEIVRNAARDLTGADGATFVLREGEFCHYADENAIAPLWKGKRFPLHTCISGWVMMNRESAVIENIYADDRIPVDAYRPTFVRSLVMVPIRQQAPIGAIGNYWASPHLASAEEVELLQTLADVASVAMENVQVYSELEQRVRSRTAQLEIANRDLEAFSYSVSHDLRAPLRAINGFVHLLTEECENALDEKAWGHITRIRSESARMKALIDDLIRLAQLSRAPLKQDTVDLSALARGIVTDYRSSLSGRDVHVEIEDGLVARGDRGLLQVVLENLLSNAWKYTSNREQPEIHFGHVRGEHDTRIFFVRDNGVGFDMQHAEKLFTPFQRLHREEEFSGTGIGLTTVQRVIERHGGRIWAVAEVGRGAVFSFTISDDPPDTP